MRYRILWLIGRGPATYVQALVLKVSGTVYVRFYYPPVRGQRIALRGRTAENVYKAARLRRHLEAGVSSNKVVLTPLIGVMEKQPRHEVEWFTIEEIKKHRIPPPKAVCPDLLIGFKSMPYVMRYNHFPH